jgi:hypothetical protein
MQIQCMFVFYKKTQLFGRVPRAAAPSAEKAAETKRRAEEREKANMLKRNAQFELLAEPDHDELQPAARLKNPKERQARKKEEGGRLDKGMEGVQGDHIDNDDDDDVGNRVVKRQRRIRKGMLFEKFCFKYLYIYTRRARGES